MAPSMITLNYSHLPLEYEGFFFFHTFFTSYISQAFVEELREKVQGFVKGAETHRTMLLTVFGTEERPTRRAFSDAVREKLPSFYQTFFMGAYETVFDARKDIATEYD